MQQHKFYHLSISDSDILQAQCFDLKAADLDNPESCYIMKDNKSQSWVIDPITTSNAQGAINALVTAKVYDALLHDTDDEPRKSPEVILLYDSVEEKYYTASKKLENYNEIWSYKRKKAQDEIDEHERAYNNLANELSKCSSRTTIRNTKDQTTRDKLVTERAAVETLLSPKTKFMNSIEFVKLRVQAGHLKFAEEWYWAQRRNLGDELQCLDPNDPLQKNKNKINAVNLKIKNLEEEKRVLIPECAKPFMCWWDIPGIFELLIVCSFTGGANNVSNIGLIGDPDDKCNAAISYCQAFSEVNYNVINVFINELSKILFVPKQDISIQSAKNNELYIVQKFLDNKDIKDKSYNACVFHKGTEPVWVQHFLNKQETEDKISLAFVNIKSRYEKKFKELNKHISDIKKLFICILKDKDKLNDNKFSSLKILDICSKNIEEHEKDLLSIKNNIKKESISIHSDKPNIDVSAYFEPLLYSTLPDFPMNSSDITNTKNAVIEYNQVYEETSQGGSEKDFKVNNRPLSKLAYDKEVVGDSSAQNLSVLNVPDDLSIVVKPQFLAEVELRKKFNISTRIPTQKVEPPSQESNMTSISLPKNFVEQDNQDPETKVNQTKPTQNSANPKAQINWLDKYKFELGSSLMIGSICGAVFTYYFGKSFTQTAIKKVTNFNNSNITLKFISQTSLQNLAKNYSKYILGAIVGMSVSLITFCITSSFKESDNPIKPNN